MFEAIGVLHVHTEHSDGTGTHRDIAAAAVESGLDFVGINDHRTLFLRNCGLLGLENGIFFLTGAELEDAGKKNHILAYGIDILPESSNTLEQLDSIHRQGGVAIAAHPCEKRGWLPGAGSYRWTHGALDGLSGIEVWNYMSQWKRNISPVDLPARLRNPDLRTNHPDRKAVDLWLQTGGCAVACPDAHALRLGVGRFAVEVFPYGMLFKRLRTHLMLEDEPDWSDAGETENMILAALSGGRCFSSNFLLGDARGFRAERNGSEILLELPGEGEVTVYSLHGKVDKGICAAGKHIIRYTDFPAFISVDRNGGTWIVCGLL